MTSEEYQQTARELARRAAMPETLAARMAKDLERAFDAAGPSREPVVHWRRRASIALLAAAAVLVMAVAGGVWYAGREPVTSNNVADASSPATGTGSARVAATEDKVHLKVDTTDRGSVRLQADQGTRSVRLQADRRHPKRLPPVIQPAGFVPVPAAARLPQFESGVIVRLALPVTALPSYGVDISPASSGQPVEADVLVGQDGLARAIRLVNTSRSQQ